MNGLRLLVIAKEPVPGRVKTRLCPPCTPQQAAAVARAALDDTLSTLDDFKSAHRTLVISGTYPAPRGWMVIPQRGVGLGERLAHAFADTDDGGPALLVGMDTPQLTAELLGDLADGLASADAVLGPAEDGGWWALALREPRYAAVLRDVPMSTADTGRLTRRALRDKGLRVAAGPGLRDVDTAADAWAVAGQCPDGRFAAAVRAHLPRVGS
jgi:rSAM/selenodomain-associated transferase 1